MPTLFTVTKFRLLVTVVLFFMAPLLNAADSSTSNAIASHNITSQSQTTSLPDWVYKELVAIQKEINVIDATGASKESVQALKERLTKVEVLLEQSQLRVDGSLKAHGERIEDIYASTDRFSYIAAWLGAIASILAVLFGWISAGRKAKSEAKKHVDTWLEGNKANLTEQLEKAKIRLTDTLENEIVSAKKQIKTLIIESKNNIGLIEADVADLKHNVTEAVLSDLKGGYTLTKEEKEKVTIEAENISNKSDIEKTAKDWRSLAIDHYFNNENSEALNSIMKAFEQDDIRESFSDYELADTLFLKCVVLDKLELPEEAIVSYSDLITKFGKIKKPELRVQVAKSLINKGTVLQKLGRLEEAVGVYVDVEKRFGESKNHELQERLAKALFNKGVALSQLNELEKAVDSYDDVIRTFKQAEYLVYQEIVARALVNKTELLICIKNKKEIKNLISETIDFLPDSFPIHRVVMEFFNFIIKEVELDSVLNFIEQITDDEKVDWEFRIIHPIIDKLDSPHKEQVKAIVSFFEEHQDKEQLKIELAKISSK